MDMALSQAQSSMFLYGVHFYLFNYILKMINKFNSDLIFQIRYKKDCLELYGRLLDNKNVISSVEGTSKNQTEDAWTTLFPGEPFELDLEVKQENTIGDGVVAEKFTKYDLVSAVQRQTPFFHQASASITSME